jgi:GH25 family lysozyme M1 (1,4-beta-N-acetylmuramidase)
MSDKTIYTVGGTVQAGGGIYIPRKADEELLAHCRASEFAFILSSRQVGKSSLMVRTAQQLEQESIRSVIIDLSSIGVNISADAWYLGILNEVANTLELKADIFSWWKERAALSPSTRMTNFFRDVLLKEVHEPVVLFFDEIDSTLSIPFADDFFASLRAIYNARSTVVDFKRLSFVMIGVATPSDLIADDKRTPFNIGHRVELTDFTPEEALPLAGDLGVRVLEWVFHWTSGHPYLTQRLCAHLSKLNFKSDLQKEDVENAIKQLFEGEQGWQDNNLQFVRDMLTKRAPNISRVLKTYKDIRTGKKVIDDERSIAKSHLKISGVVHSENGFLQPRNQIYKNIFNAGWAQENIPKNWQKVALISLSAVLGILVLGTLAVFMNDYLVGLRIQKHFRGFISATSPSQRLFNLAGIYREEGILSNKDSNLIAAQLFYGLSSVEDQLTLFVTSEISQSPDLQNDLVVVIVHLYITVVNVNPQEDNTLLLKTMHDSLRNVSNKQIAEGLQNEIAAWLDGRKNFEDKNYKDALASYDKALSLSPGNHAMLYERARVYIALEQYTLALQDLDATLGFAKQSAPDIEVTPILLVSPYPIATTPISSEIVITESVTPSSVPTTLTPAETIVPPIALTQPPDQPPSPAYTPNRKYESKFTTLIDIVNAVRELIENNPQLQSAMRANESAYPNLQLFGLTSITSPTQLSILGPDISFYQDDPETSQGIDFEKMKKSANFVIIRAGQNVWVDSDFKTNWIAAKQAGLPRGSYWFYDSRTDPVRQAELWVQLFDGDLGELPLFVDLEESYDGSYKGWENWRIFLETMKQLVPGKEIAIYTYYSYWSENAPSAVTDAANLEYFHQYPLWAADFSKTEPTIPKPWSKNEWLFWMYTETGDGELYGVESKGIDLNYFNGSAADFQQFLISSANASSQIELPTETQQPTVTACGPTWTFYGDWPSRYYYPTINCYRLDWCYASSDCGYHAADAWCKAIGEPGTISYLQATDVGEITIQIGTGQTCNASYCDSFEYIECVTTE